MACTDCGGSVPGPYWQRCYDCAHERARRLMSPFPVEAPSRARRRWCKGDRVALPSGEVGVVARAARTSDTIVVALPDGTRRYVGPSALREAS